MEKFKNSSQPYFKKGQKNKNNIKSMLKFSKDISIMPFFARTPNFSGFFASFYFILFFKMIKT